MLGMLLTVVNNIAKMKIEINLPVFADLPADQQITIYREIQNSIQAMSDDKALRQRCRILHYSQDAGATAPTVRLTGHLRNVTIK